MEDLLCGDVGCCIRMFLTASAIQRLAGVSRNVRQSVLSHLSNENSSLLTRPPTRACTECQRTGEWGVDLSVCWTRRGVAIYLCKECMGDEAGFRGVLPVTDLEFPPFLTREAASHWEGSCATATRLVHEGNRNVRFVWRADWVRLQGILDSLVAARESLEICL